jgi:hypothetical protein
MKKAQLQMMENAFVLLIIFVILIIAFVFVVGMQKSAQNDKIQEFKELELIKKSQILNFLPEMQCSDNNIIDPDCYDILKIEAFKQQIEENPDYYNTLLGKINLTVKKFEPSPDYNEWNGEWNIYDNTKGEDEGVRQVQFPVLLKNVTEKADYFGVVIIGVYE